jgi:hypothetical protein
LKHNSRPGLTPAQQYLFLKVSPICHGTGSLSPNGLRWEYRVRPILLSREYLVRITFKRDDTPKVFVIEPDITALAGGRKIPHVYHNPLSLCLFLPRANEWVGKMRIDQTFVPWAATWLFYFEDWLATDEWKGGGEHPSDNASEMGNRRARRILR